MKKVVEQIQAQHSAERAELGEALIAFLRDNLPWGETVDLGLGRTATLTTMNGQPGVAKIYRKPIYPDGPQFEADPTAPPPELGDWRMIFDFRLENCDQDHIEVMVEISGGGGMA